MNKDYYSRSVLRALSILNVIGDDSVGISEISQKLELSKGTVFSLIKTLESMDFVTQDPQSEKYMIGPALLKLASRKMRNMDIVSISRFYLQQVADEVGEITHLAIRDGFSVLFLDRVENNSVKRMLRLDSRVGDTSPLHCTSMGKVILSTLSKEEFDLYTETCELKRFTQHTITNPEQLWQEICQVRDKGYALNNGEHEEGLTSLAVPIKDMNQKTVAAINIAAPSARMTEEKIPYFYHHLVKASEAISKEMFF